jgi:hypothetical protein
MTGALLSSYTAHFPWSTGAASITVVGADAGTLEDLYEYALELRDRWDTADPDSDVARVAAARPVPTSESQLLAAVARDALGVPLNALAEALAVDLIAGEAEATDAVGWWIRVGAAARAAGACPVADGWQFDLPRGEAAPSWVSVRAGGIAVAAEDDSRPGACACAPHAWIAMREAFQLHARPYEEHGPLPSGVSAWLLGACGPRRWSPA